MNMTFFCLCAFGPWGSSLGRVQPGPSARPVLAEPRPARPVPTMRKQAPVASRAATHGSLPVNISNWFKILGDKYHGPQV
jgi:hypothetical protein